MAWAHQVKQAYLLVATFGRRLAKVVPSVVLAAACSGESASNEPAGPVTSVTASSTTSTLVVPTSETPAGDTMPPSTAVPNVAIIPNARSSQTAVYEDDVRGNLLFTVDTPLDPTVVYGEDARAFPEMLPGDCFDQLWELALKGSYLVGLEDLAREAAVEEYILAQDQAYVALGQAIAAYETPEQRIDALNGAREAIRAAGDVSAQAVEAVEADNAEIMTEFVSDIDDECWVGELEEVPAGYQVTASVYGPVTGGFRAVTVDLAASPPSI